MFNPIQEFNYYRSCMNEQLLSEASTTLKLIFNPYKSTFQRGGLDLAIKELLGLVASTVLRCYNCIKYHFERCHEEKLTKKAKIKALEIATVIESSIVIPHLKKAHEYWQQIELNTK